MLATLSTALFRVAETTQANIKEEQEDRTPLSSTTGMTICASSAHSRPLKEIQQHS